MGLLQRSLRARALTFVLLLAIVPVGVIGYIGYNSGRQSIENEVKNHLESVAILKEQEIKNWVVQMEHTLIWLAASPQTTSDAAILDTHDTGDPEYSDAHDTIAAELMRIAELGDVSEVFLLEPTSGQIIAASDVNLEGKFRVTEPYFILGKNSTYISDIFHSLTLAQPTMVISTPVRESEGELLGVLAAYANMDKLNELMLERSGLGETGETYLVGGNNLLLTETRYVPGQTFRKWVFTEAVSRALNGESGTGLYLDYRDEPVIGAYRWVEDMKLVLLAEMNQSEAFAPVGSLRNTIALVAGLILVVAVGFGFLQTRQIISPLTKLAEYARKVGKGEYTAEVEIKGEDEVASVASDVKAMVEQLLQTQGELSLILETTSDAMMTVDRDFNVIKTNAAIASLSGMDSETSAGKKCFNVFGGELCHTEECLLSRVLGTKAKVTVETTKECQDGTKPICVVTASPLFDENGVIIGVLEDIVDITERKQMQEKLLESERLATLGQFSGNISHELRNPLGVIDSSAYYLKTKLKDADEKVHEHLDRIKSSVGSSTAIIESLLNLTRMKEPQLEESDLITIAHDSIATSKMPATLDIIQNFPEQKVLVNADREQLRMAFKNIIKNADEAMAGKGTLTVTVGRTADSQVEVSFADTGPGIAVEDLGKVFQPLFSRKAKGIGFGLSIARMVVDKHGGTIEAKSEPGKGTNIIIQLPTYTDKDKEV